MKQLTSYACLLLALSGCAAPPTGPTPLEASNKAVVLRWLEEGDNQRNFELADELFAPDVILHHPTSPEPLRGPEVIKQGAKGLAAAFEGYRGVNHDVIVEGDKVVVRWTIHGKHVGEFMGIPPSGNEINLPGISIYQVRDGRIVEGWYSVDMLVAMQQLGALPTPAPTPSPTPAE